jgi:P27 family predicted phage terminase small subunit
MKVPEYFNEVATKYFDFVVKNVEKLTPSDQPIVEGLAFNLATLEECQKTLLREGYVIDALHGKKEHPAVGISMKAQSKVLESFKLLGLDASSKLKEEQAKPEDLSNDPVLRVLSGKF